MKILIAVTSHLSAVLVRGQGEWLINRGHEVIFSSSEGKMANALVHDEKLVYEPVDFSRNINIRKDLLCVWKCIKIIRKHRPDIVNAGTPKAGLLYMIASFFCGVKVRIFTLRGLRSSSLAGSKRKVVRFFEKISCVCASKIIVISPSLKEEVIRLKLVENPDKLLVIAKGSSNGVDLDRFMITHEVETSTLEILDKLGIDGNAFIFGFIGRLVKDKGIEELVEAYLHLKKESEQSMVLLLVGDYEKDNDLSENTLNIIKYETSIIQLGFISEIPQYAYLIDVLILYSYREGFGNVVIEAAAMKTPAIVADIPGARDTVEDGVTGFLVNPNSVDSLRQKMAEYLSDRTLVKKHGENGRKRVEKFFSNKSIWAEQEKVYVHLLSS